MLTLVVSLLVLLVGLVCLPQLEVENLPAIAPSRVSVRATYPGASPEVVEQGVTALLEKQLNGVERLDQIRSVSAAGSSSINLTFTGDPEINQINTQNEVAVVQRQLPAPVARFGVQVRRSSDDLLMVLSSAPIPPPSRRLPQRLGRPGGEGPAAAGAGVGNVNVAGGSSLAFGCGSTRCGSRSATSPWPMCARPCRPRTCWRPWVSWGPPPARRGRSSPCPCAWRALRSPAEFEQLVVAQAPMAA